MTDTVDLLIGDAVRIRVSGATGRLVDSLAMQLGAAVSHLDGAEPHVVVRVNGATRTRSHASGNGTRPVTVDVLDASPGRPVPALRALILLVALGEGWAPLHAATVAGPRGVLAIAGPPGAGKTSLQLGLTARGATPIAAEWLLLGHDRIVPFVQPIRVRGTHVAAHPGLIGALPLRGAMALGVSAAAMRLLPAFPPARRLARVVRSDVAPERLAARLGPGVDGGVAIDIGLRTLDTLVLVAPGADLGLRTSSPGEVVPRLVNLMDEDLGGATDPLPGWAGVSGPDGIAWDWRERLTAALEAALASTRCIVVAKDAARGPLLDALAREVMG